MAPRQADRVLGDVGIRLHELRRARRLTQEQMAEAAEVSVGWIQQAESGRANLGLRTLVRLADLLEVDVAELFRRPRTKKAAPGRPRTTPRKTAERPAC